MQGLTIPTGVIPVVASDLRSLKNSRHFEVQHHRHRHYNYPIPALNQERIDQRIYHRTDR